MVKNIYIWIDHIFGFVRVIQQNLSLQKDCIKILVMVIGIIITMDFK